MTTAAVVGAGPKGLANASRSAGTMNPIWPYAHVPFGYSGDATAAIVGQIERFAPGFRERVVATISTSTADLQAFDANYIAGDTMGANDPP